MLRSVRTDVYCLSIQSWSRQSYVSWWLKLVMKFFESPIMHAHIQAYRTGHYMNCQLFAVLPVHTAIGFNVETVTYNNLKFQGESSLSSGIGRCVCTCTELHSCTTYVCRQSMYMRVYACEGCSVCLSSSCHCPLQRNSSKTHHVLYTYIVCCTYVWVVLSKPSVVSHCIIIYLRNMTCDVWVLYPYPSLPLPHILISLPPPPHTHISPSSPCCMDDYTDASSVGPWRWVHYNSVCMAR